LGICSAHKQKAVNEMQTIFIVNPKAGKGNKIQTLTEAILSAANEIGADVRTYITKEIGDAQIYVQNYCNNMGPARFIACGGDGTLNEVVNGAMAHPEAEVGVLPMGTGNDFCRNFEDRRLFSSIVHQIKGSCVLCDAIRYQTTYQGRKKEGYGVNMFNIGFDCNVADMTAEMKKKPFISGSFAYFISILLMLIQKKGATLYIEMDGETVQDGRLLLTSVANGQYCGGGIQSNPQASVFSGRMNGNIRQNVTRLKVMNLLPHYMKGTIMQARGADEYVISKDCKRLLVKPASGSMRICVDGEIMDAGNVTFEIVPRAFRFVVPKKEENEQE